MTDGWGASQSDVIADMREAMQAAWMRTRPEDLNDVFLPASLFDAGLAQGITMRGYSRLPSPPEPMPMTEKAWTYTRPPARPSVKLNAWENRQRAKAKATAKRVAASKAARKARKR